MTILSDIEDNYVDKFDEIETYCIENDISTDILNEICNQFTECSKKGIDTEKTMGLIKYIICAKDIVPNYLCLQRLIYIRGSKSEITKYNKNKKHVIELVNIFSTYDVYLSDIIIPTDIDIDIAMALINNDLDIVPSDYVRRLGRLKKVKYLQTVIEHIITNKDKYTNDYLCKIDQELDKYVVGKFISNALGFKKIVYDTLAINGGAISNNDDE